MLSFFALWLSFAAYALAGTCQFNLELTWGPGSPDGFTRDMVFINGQFPGPLLEIQQDEWVEITVVNKMPFNATIHAHGIEQLNTAWADGVPGLTQRPIQPGDSYTYKWHAGQYGSYFYHAHSRGLIDDGCFGPMIIRPKPGTVKPFDKIAPAEVDLLEAAESKSTPLLLTDWRHKTSMDTWDLQLKSGVESAQCMDSILINGKGAVNCWPREDITKFTKPAAAPLLAEQGLQMTDKGCLPAKMLPILLNSTAPTNLEAIPPEVFDVCSPTQGSREVIKATQSKKWMAFDIISAASIDTFAFSIDEHPMWVYAVDGHYIEPLKVDAINVGNGDRFSVFIQLNKPASNYGIRAADIALAQLIDTLAVLSYDGGFEHYGNHTGDGDVGVVNSVASINRGGNAVSNSTVFFDQAKMVAFPPQFPQPAPQVDQTFIMTLKTVENSYTWVLNNTPFNHGIDDSNPPLLWQDPNAYPDDDITLKTKNGTWIDLIFNVVTLRNPPHPIHKHSNKGFIIGQGTGEFTWGSVAEAAAAVPASFNLVTPAYRDSFATPATVQQASWLAVRYQVVNPGPFMIHCHVQSHLNGGMAMVILDGVDEWPEVPDHYKN